MGEKNSDGKVQIFIDEPLKDENLDKFGHKHYVNVIKNIINNYHGSQLNIGLFGRWGVGKTTIIDLLKKEIDKDNKNQTVMFDCWKYSNEPVSLRRKFLLEVAEQIGESPDKLIDSLYIKTNRQTKDLSILQSGQSFGQSFKNLKESFPLALGLIIICEFLVFIILRLVGEISLNQSIELFFTAFAVTIVYYVVGVLRKYTTNVTITKSDKNLRSLEQFEKAFKDLIKNAEKRKKKIIIFVDDLDRCQGKKVIEVLETIKTFMNIKNCIFVIACDDSIIRKALVKENISDKNYMDKIFQVNIAIPPFRQEKIKEYAIKLLEDLNIEIPQEQVREVIDVLIYRNVANPRKVKILLNNYSILYTVLMDRLKEGEYLNDNFIIDFRLLAKITVIQTEYPDIFYDLEKNNKLLSYIDKVRCGEKIFPEYEKSLLSKYFEIYGDSTVEFKIKEGYEETIEYLNYTSTFSVSPEKLKPYIYLSQDNINTYYSDEYVENLESMLISRNANGFIELFNQTRTDNDKIQIFRNLLQRIDRYQNLELVNTLCVTTNQAVINIIPKDIKNEFAGTILNKVQEKEDDYYIFDISGIVNYIDIIGKYNKYSNIIDGYVSMLSLDNIDTSIKIVDSICSSINLVFDLEPFDNFLIKLFNTDPKQILKLVGKYTENEEVLNKYFTGQLFTSIMEYEKEYSNDEKEVLSQYLSKIKENMIIKNSKILIDKTLPYINDKYPDLSRVCIDILNEMINREIKLDEYVNHIIDILCKEINLWDGDDVTNLIFAMILKLSKQYAITNELKTKIITTLCNYYSQGREFFVKNYINNVSQILKEYGNIDIIINNINSVISSVKYADISYKYLIDYINNIREYIRSEDKKSITQNIINILNSRNYQVDEDLVKAIYALLSNCTFIIYPEMVNQLSDILINITNYQNKNPYPVSDEIVKLTYKEYSDLIALFSTNSLRNQYFNSLSNKINADNNLNGYAIEEFIKHYTLLEDSPIRSEILNNIMQEDYKIINDNPGQIIDIIIYYGNSIISELFEAILTFINNKFSMTEKIDNANKVISTLDYKNKDVELRILNSIFKIFDEKVQINILNYLFADISVRDNTMNLFINNKIDSKYLYIVNPISQKINDEEERKKYYLLIEDKIKNSAQDDELKRLLHLFIAMKDNKYLELNEANSIITNLIVYLLQGGQAYKTQAIKFILLYYNEHKLPKGMVEKITLPLSKIIESDENLRKTTIDVVCNSGLCDYHTRDVNKLKENIKKYSETKTEIENV